MLIIKPSFVLFPESEETSVYRTIEYAARTCYRSEERMTDDGASARVLIKKLLARGHEAMLEFFDITVLFAVDRGVSHELVRHRLASFAQESTRYCDYGKDGEIQVILPGEWLTEADGSAYYDWERAVLAAEVAYNALRAKGVAPQIARSVLPTCLATHIVVKANLREWRHILALRTAHAAHPQMRQVMVPLAAVLRERLPLIFGGD